MKKVVLIIHIIFLPSDLNGASNISCNIYFQSCISFKSLIDFFIFRTLSIISYMNFQPSVLVRRCLVRNLNRCLVYKFRNEDNKARKFKLPTVQIISVVSRLTPDPLLARFGLRKTNEAWNNISKLSYTFNFILHTLPTVCFDAKVPCTKAEPLFSLQVQN